MCDPRNLATSITESCNEIQNSDKTLSGYTPAAGREGYAWRQVPRLLAASGPDGSGTPVLHVCSMCSFSKV